MWRFPVYTMWCSWERPKNGGLVLLGRLGAAGYGVDNRGFRLSDLIRPPLKLTSNTSRDAAKRVHAVLRSS